jgi:hypothetical protein
MAFLRGIYQVIANPSYFFSNVVLPTLVGREATSS